MFQDCPLLDDNTYKFHHQRSENKKNISFCICYERRNLVGNEKFVITLLSFLPLQNLTPCFPKN
jgi:hypothetical protein